MRRVATALVLVPVVLVVVAFAPYWLFVALLLLVALLAVREFYGLARSSGLEPYPWIGIAGTAALAACFAVPWGRGARPLTAVLLALLLAVLLRALSRPERIPAALGDAAATALGALYLGLLMGALGAIRLLPVGEAWLIFLLLVVWLGDTAALYCGRAWGRHALAPRVSPGKSWEGAAASFVVALLVGVVCAVWQGAPVLVPLAGALNIAAQFGDLAESLLKRAGQAKDSGRLLPGHGGVLDRVDAMLFAAPVLWYYLAFLHL
ncbi:MAG: phosphatidate cytidylyltransferase [Terriglobales bacterium]